MSAFKSGHLSVIWYYVYLFTKAVNLSITLLIVLNYFNNSKKNINFATEKGEWLFLRIPICYNKVFCMDCLNFF